MASYKYIVFEANLATKTYLSSDSIGIEIFDGGGAKNCRLLTDCIVSTTVGNLFGTQIFALIIARTDTNDKGVIEYDEVMSAGLNFIAEFADSTTFMAVYSA